MWHMLSSNGGDFQDAQLLNPIRRECASRALNPTPHHGYIAQFPRCETGIQFLLLFFLRSFSYSASWVELISQLSTKAFAPLRLRSKHLFGGKSQSGILLPSTKVPSSAAKCEWSTGSFRLPSLATPLLEDVSQSVLVSSKLATCAGVTLWDKGLCHHAVIGMNVLCTGHISHMIFAVTSRWSEMWVCAQYGCRIFCTEGLLLPSLREREALCNLTGWMRICIWVGGRHFLHLRRSWTYTLKIQEKLLNYWTNLPSGITE